MSFRDGAIPYSNMNLLDSAFPYFSVALTYFFCHLISSTSVSVQELFSISYETAVSNLGSTNKIKGTA